jgi:hypothetical protein
VCVFVYVSPMQEQPSPRAAAMPPRSPAAQPAAAAAADPEPAPAAAALEHKPVDLSCVANAKALETLGLERLKVELSRHGLKAGGSLAERAARLFLLADTPLAQLDRKHFAKK